MINKDHISDIEIKPIVDYLSKGIKQGYVYLDELAEIIPEKFIHCDYIEDIFNILEEYKISIYNSSPLYSARSAAISKDKKIGTVRTNKKEIERGKKKNWGKEKFDYSVKDMRMRTMEYLGQTSDSWDRFSERVASEIEEVLLKEMMMVPYERRSISINLYEEFVSPSTVYLISRCKNADELKILMKKIISESGYTFLDDYSETIIEKIIKYIPLVNFKHATEIVRLNLVDPSFYDIILTEPKLLRTLNWRIFEEMLADMLKRFGYEVELQKGSKDGGIDIFALKKDLNFGTHRYILQAKRHKNKIGVEPVRQLLFLHDHYKATKSCLATTATFTKGAWQLAKQYKWILELKDIEGILEWVKMVQAIKKHNMSL